MVDRHQKQLVCLGDVSKANISPLVRILRLQKAGANLMGADLYNNLIRYFVTHLKGLRAVGIALSIAVQCSRAITSANRVSAGRSAITVLCGRMVSIHDWGKLHQSSLHVSQSPLGQEGTR